jgi:hypothetical protein
LRSDKSLRIVQLNSLETIWVYTTANSPF